MLEEYPEMLAKVVADLQELKAENERAEKDMLLPVTMVASSFI